jgi:hypothetical protein
MGWPLVNLANRHAAFSKAPEPGLLGGTLPVAHNAVAMLTGYISASQRVIACPNQDARVRAGFFDNLDTAPSFFRYQTLATDSGCMRCMTRVQTKSRTSASNTARNPELRRDV